MLHRILMIACLACLLTACASSDNSFLDNTGTGGSGIASGHLTGGMGISDSIGP